jgi:hypothetical protein
VAYYRDTEVELKGSFYDETQTPHALADPTGVTLEVLSPAGVLTTKTYSAGDLTKEGTGVYTYLQTLDVSGTWYYRFKGTGAVKVAGWKPLPVIDDPLD